jgi:hypothetical protein
MNMSRGNIGIARAAFTIIMIAVVGRAALGQAFFRDSGSDATITAAVRAEVIEGVLRELNKAYVFPEVAKKMEEAVHARVAAQDYAQITSAQEFARKLTDDLRAISHDKHLFVHYVDQNPIGIVRREPGPDEREKQRRFAAAHNFGFEKG